MSSKQATTALPAPVHTPAIAAALDMLVAEFSDRRTDLLIERGERRTAMRAGTVERSEATAHIRKAAWSVDPVPELLLERRVELLGGVTREELIAGLNGGAKSYVADLWSMTAGQSGSAMEAHKVLKRAAFHSLTWMHPEEGRKRINPNGITRLMFVPRPLHVVEHEVHVSGTPAPAAFVDLAVFLGNCGAELQKRQGGAYLYLRGIHGHLEARLWKDMFQELEEAFELPRGTVRVTVMVDNVTAALEAEEILFELMHHSAGLSLDPQAYAADHITLFSDPDHAPMPDRESIGLNAHMLRSVSLLVIGAAHKRGAHAIGAPSFVLPPTEDGRIRPGYAEMMSDKEREAVDGHDGTLVAHPGLVNGAMTEFNKSMPRAHQMYYQRRDRITAADLIRRPEGTISVESLVNMIRTALRSMVGHRLGFGWVTQGGRVHDRTSARLAILLLWQWNLSRQGVISMSGLEVHDDLIKYLIRKEEGKLFAEADAGTRGAAKAAAEELIALVLDHDLPTTMRD